MTSKSYSYTILGAGEKYSEDHRTLNRRGVGIGKSRPALSGAGARVGQEDDRDERYKNRGREEKP